VLTGERFVVGPAFAAGQFLRDLPEYVDGRVPRLVNSGQ
jgi:hypothetical protein